MKTKFTTIAVGALALLSPLAAMASTAANTVISNTATVNYNDAGGTAQTPVTSAAATVTVTLVPSAVTLSSPANQTISQGTSATLTYTITSTANGADTYNLSSSVTAANLSTVTGTLSVTSISLGGTTLAIVANVGDTSITVPYDNNVGGASTVNGIGAGSIIVLGGNAYTVSSITKNAGANTTVISISGSITASATVGSTIGERKTFTETVPSGTVTSGSSGTQTVSDTAVSATLNTATTTQTTPTVITVQRPTLTVTKLVSVDGGTTYSASGSAAPGTTLIYKITATNGGASSATSVAFTDVVPGYLSYVAGSGKFATASATTYASATALTEGSGGYTFTGGTSTVAYNPGGATGTVAAAGVLVLFFEAKIN